MSLTTESKDLLRNVIKNTETHNKFVETDEMWKSREKEDDLEKKNTSRLYHPGLENRLPHAHMDDSQDGFYRKRPTNFRRAYIPSSSVNTNSDRWEHSGFEELYGDKSNEYAQNISRNVEPVATGSWFNQRNRNNNVNRDYYSRNDARPSYNKYISSKPDYNRNRRYGPPENRNDRSYRQRRRSVEDTKYAPKISMKISEIKAPSKSTTRKRKASRSSTSSESSDSSSNDEKKKTKAIVHKQTKKLRKHLEKLIEKQAKKTKEPKNGSRRKSSTSRSPSTHRRIDDKKSKRSRSRDRYGKSRDRQQESKQRR